MKKHIEEVAHVGKQSFVTALKKIPSRRLFVFLIATHMTYISLLDPQSWLLVALLYLGLIGGSHFTNLIPNILKTPVPSESPEKPEEPTPNSP